MSPVTRPTFLLRVHIASNPLPAKGALNELRHLRIGMVAPDIIGEDIDGKQFKLSDYRGKVVLIDFWGNW